MITKNTCVSIYLKVGAMNHTEKNLLNYYKNKKKINTTQTLLKN